MTRGQRFDSAWLAFCLVMFGYNLGVHSWRALFSAAGALIWAWCWVQGSPRGRPAAPEPSWPTDHANTVANFVAEPPPKADS